MRTKTRLTWLLVVSLLPALAYGALAAWFHLRLDSGRPQVEQSCDCDPWPFQSVES